MKIYDLGVILIVWVVLSCFLVGARMEKDHDVTDKLDAILTIEESSNHGD